MTVRTRFAPSPTGYLHIGGVRTALFNWLYARQHGGQFILRIDDTDQGRNVEAALAPILAGFRWLGLDWDEGPEVGGPHAPYYQSQRADRHRAAVERLIASGHAYRDYSRPEELEAEKQAAGGGSYAYSRRWMAETDAQAASFETEGRTAVVRLKMPREGVCQFHDAVRGDMTVEWSSEQDHVIQRADGSCLYNLATVVDDIDFEITDVIRAVEHLSNTARQIFICRALGHEPPRYAHVPFVAEPGSKDKISKRKLDKYLKHPEFKRLYDHGATKFPLLGLPADSETLNPVLTDFYQQAGYLPEAVLNYVLLLGWSLDDKTEDFTREEMIRSFNLERINKAPASFDPAKLEAFQERHMSRLPLKKKTALAVDFLRRAGWVGSPPSCDTGPHVAAVLTAAGDRVRIAADILDYPEFFLSDEQLEYDPKAVDKRLRAAGAAERLRALREDLAVAEPFTAEALERTLQAFLERHGIKIGEVIHALRVAVTGRAVGVGMFETLEILGRDKSLRRIDRALELL